MNILNSLTKQIEEIKPITPGKIGMYSCGPTVYNNLHIGNLAAFIYADLLRRILSADYDVKAVMNITDVDDKTIRDSKRDYPDIEAKDALLKLTRKYEDVFMKDIQRIGIDTSAITFIRATDTIPEMISLTQELLDKNIAYIAEDGVYFSIKDYEAAGFPYGVLQKIDRSHEHARIANDEYDKDHVSDFALWKRSMPGEPSWEAAFTHNNTVHDIPGRPGWHIECSAMSQKLLDIPFDIHTGGIDLKFPHHENEIAQSRGATGANSFANYFVHNNHILVDGKKMSKSIGNFFTLRDVEEKGYSPLAFRLLVLSSHYSKESNFTWDILEAAQQRLKSWQAAADLRWQTVVYDQDRHPLQPDELKSSMSAINDALSNNMSSPEAIAEIHSTLKQATLRNIDNNTRSDFDLYLKFVNECVGIDLLSSQDIDNAQKELIKDRDLAKDNSDWESADLIREKLLEQGIALTDTQHGTKWSRV